MAALTQKNGFENELISSMKDRFKEYINSDLHSFTLAEKKEYATALAKMVNKDNILDLSKFRNNFIKQHIDGKINIL